MQHLVIRTGSRIKRRLGLILAVAALVVALIFLVQPKRWFGQPHLELVALDANGLFEDSIALPRAWADTTFQGAYGASARVPLVLGVRNVGSMEGGARWLSLSLPSRYRLETGDGRELAHRSEAGNPLIRYIINGPFPPVEPGRLPTVLPAVDTVWLEPVVPQLYCVSVGDSVPEFVAAAQPDPRLLAHIQIFYSFAGGPPRLRQAGLLSVRLDPSLVDRPPSTPPPAYPTRIQEPAWPFPNLGDLRRAGTTVARCGPPDAPMEVRSTTWQSDAGRLIALEYGGKVRKYLFDLNRDSIVDLEMWDGSGKGRFDAERNAHYPIPPFLLPPPGPPPFNPAAFAGLTPDSAARLYNFREAGVYRPTTGPQDSAGALDRFHGAGGYTPSSRPTGMMAPAPVQPGAAPRAPAAPPVRNLPTPPGVKLLGKPVPTPRKDSGR